MLRGCATAASGQVCTARGVIECPVHKAGAVQSEWQHLAGRTAARCSDRRRRSPAAVPAENEAFAAPEIRHLSEKLIRCQNDGFAQRVKIIRQRALNVRNVDGADGRTARLIVADQGQENVIVPYFTSIPQEKGLSHNFSQHFSKRFQETLHPINDCAGIYAKPLCVLAHRQTIKEHRVDHFPICRVQGNL